MITRHLSALLAMTLLGALTSPVTADAATRPRCVLESVTKNGEAIPTDFVAFNAGACTKAHHSVHWVMFDRHVPGGDYFKTGAQTELGPEGRNATYVLTFDLGLMRPRVTRTIGDGLKISRERSSDGHWRLTLTARPIELSRGTCERPYGKWICGINAEVTYDGLLEGWISDHVTQGNKAQRRAYAGMDFNSNIENWTNLPRIHRDSRGAPMLDLILANSYRLERADNRVFRGWFHLVVPDALLHAVYGVDPEALTAKSFRYVLTGPGSGRVLATDVGDAWRFDVRNMTFPKYGPTPDKYYPVPERHFQLKVQG